MYKTKWASKLSEIKSAADLFIKFANSSYISHGEIQWGRAEDFETWGRDLKTILIEEFRACLRQKKTAHLALLVHNKEVVGLSFVQFFDGENGKFMVLEDILLHPDHRGGGRAFQLYRHVEDFAKSQGANRIFLESGIRNRKAHRFLHSLGFDTCSHVMVKELK